MFQASDHCQPINSFPHLSGNQLLQSIPSIFASRAVGVDFSIYRNEATDRIIYQAEGDEKRGRREKAIDGDRHILIRNIGCATGYESL